MSEIENTIRELVKEYGHYEVARAFHSTLEEVEGVRAGHPLTSAIFAMDAVVSSTFKAEREAIYRQSEKSYA